MSTASSLLSSPPPHAGKREKEEEGKAEREKRERETEKLTIGNVTFVLACSSGLCAMHPQVSKYRESSEAANDVHVALGLVSLPDYMTDILISLNTPLSINPKSSTYTYTSEVELSGSHRSSDMTNTNTNTSFEKDQNRQLFRAMLETFKVVDYRLFGHG